MTKVSVVGLGYIGLPTAAILAKSGAEVIGVDVNLEVVQSLNEGLVHIVEPGLDEIVKQVVKSGLLRAVSIPEESDVFIIAVPTPFKEGNVADISYVEAAAQSIALVLKQGDIIILESTSPVGTTEKLVDLLAVTRTDLKFPTGVNLENTDSEVDIHLAYCPERVLPGNIMAELVQNDRIIGGITKKCTERASAIYKIFLKGECLETNARTAEMAKLTENAYRDTNIAFANELSMISDRLDINVWELIQLANRHPRVNILQPGPGVGGHCIAVDPWFIVQSAPEEAKLISMARQVNDAKPAFVLKKVNQAVMEVVNPTIVCLGLAFKANIDDLRESPAVVIAKTLSTKTDLRILIVEPYIDELPIQLQGYDHVRLVSYDEGLREANVVVLLVDHEVFLRKPDSQVLEGKKIIDTRGIWS